MVVVVGIGAFVAVANANVLNRQSVCAVDSSEKSELSTGFRLATDVLSRKSGIIFTLASVGFTATVEVNDVD